MAQDNQYLNIQIGDASFLLHGAASLAIEKRNNLLPATANSNAVAWRADKAGNWPTFELDSELRLSNRNQWQRSVFLLAAPYPMGLAADDIHLLTDDEIRPEPFTPVGCWIPGVGRLFSSAWVHEGQVHLVLDPGKLASYLQTLEQSK